MTGRLRRWIPAIGVFLTFIAVWEGLVRVFDIRNFILPAPSGILGAFPGAWPEVWPASIGTFLSALGGLTLGTVLGILAAAGAARWPMVREGAMPLAITANSTPIIVLAPVANAWFGLLSPWSTIVVVAVLVFFPIMINMVRGLLSTSASELELMASYAATRKTMLWKLQLPGALPYMFSALKVAAALSLIGAIVKEYFGGSQQRLGQYLTLKAGNFQFEEVWTAILLASAFGIGLYLLITLIERRYMGWHVSVRAAKV
ncbi:MAG: ABC transporter permease [Acidimicrobiia bacterium]|nr:ABC transporter permease [Acidimicrobiia bacterium]